MGEVVVGLLALGAFAYIAIFITLRLFLGVIRELQNLVDDPFAYDEEDERLDIEFWRRSR